MKKSLFLLLFCSFQMVWGQTNIAVPNYSSVTNSFNYSTGNVKFYLNGVSHTLNVGHGANGVCFFGNNMFVAYDDNSGTGNGIIWYSNVSFSSGTFTSNAPVILANNQQTSQVVADANGNIYCSNFDGTITKFLASGGYSSGNIITTTFFSTGGSLSGGLMIDDATNTIWATENTFGTLGVAKLSNFTNVGVKSITISNNYLSLPEGIAKSPNGTIWVANNNYDYICKINSSVVTTIVNELNSNDYTTKAIIGGTDVIRYSVDAFHVYLGGLTYDGVYSNKMYVNSQNANNSNYNTQYSFDPTTNGTPVFTSTTFSQVYPGNGQAAIIPCTLLPTPNNPITASANPATINSGQSSILISSGCVAGTTYRWKEGATILNNAFDYTTPFLNTTTTYTAHCVSGGTCQSSGTPVTVTVNNPLPLSVTASPTAICEGAYSYLTASNCAGTVSWSNGFTGTAQSVYPSITTPFTATCSTGGTASATVTVNPNPAITVTSTMPTIIPDCNSIPAIYLHTGESTTLNVTGCTGTVTWYDYPNSGVGVPLVVTMTEVGSKYINFICTHANGCTKDGMATIHNQFATDDTFYTYMSNTLYGNVRTNDTQQNIALGAYMATPPSHGSIIWTMSMGRPTGAFTYTPNTGYVGTDSFTYYDSDDLTCTQRATVTINVTNYTHAILSCSELSPSPGLFRVGATSSNSIKVYLNVIASSGNITLNVTGPNFSGTATQFFMGANPNAFMWVPIDYDGGGTAGTRNLTISSSDVSVPTCSKTVTVFDAPIFSFTSCSNGTINGIFASGTASTATLTVAIAVTQAGPATIVLDEFANTRMSGTYTTNLTMGQTSLTVPFNYNGTGIAGDGGQLTLYSMQGQGLGSSAAFCYGPNYIISAPSPCPNTVTISASPVAPNYVANEIIKASDYINTISPPNIVISPTNSNNLTFQAGKSVNLTPGFSVSNGAVFTAKIADCISTPAHETFYVEGRNLKDPCGNTVILRGLNKMHVWTDQNGASIPEMALTGANAVRIVWTINNNGLPTDDSKLDNLIGLCITNKMIPIVELHDATCNWAGLQSLVDYWKRAAILTIINKYKHAMILNIGNEVGDFNVTAAQFETGYNSAVLQLRTAGITVPLMIDAPNCGGNIDILLQKGQSIITNDPLHNILLSVHTYWPMNNAPVGILPNNAPANSGYGTAAYITTKFEAAVTANLPLLVGEFANYGAWNWNYDICQQYGQVNYQWIATECNRLGIGYLAWDFGPGNTGGGNPNCNIMDMTTNATYATLYGWGADIVGKTLANPNVNNAPYTIKFAQKTPYILSGFQNCN